jgi:hypothetical protein
MGRAGIPFQSSEAAVCKASYHNANVEPQPQTRHLGFFDTTNTRLSARTAKPNKRNISRGELLPFDHNFLIGDPINYHFWSCCEVVGFPPNLGNSCLSL